MGRPILFISRLAVFLFFLIISHGIHAQSLLDPGEAKAYPNPFRENITIEYQLHQDGSVEVQINNILGQKIRTLVKEDQPGGKHRVKWDGLDESGSTAGTGMYYITLRTPKERVVIKVLKTK
jgi:hypothetical protein